MKKISALAVLLVTVAGSVLAGSPASAAAVAVELCATTGTVSLPGAPSVPIWGFGIPSTPGDCATATASLPGPLLTANVGDTVTLTVRNNLPPGTGNITHLLRFEIPGTTFAAGPVEAAPGATVTVSFTADRPGTYQYQSGGDAGRQEAMGLAGAFIVRPAPGQAYGPATAFDVEAVLVLSAVDPAFNAAPDTFGLHAYRATAWLINGHPYPNAGITATAGQRVLLRYVNAGFDNTSMALLGMHQRVVGRDARPLGTPFDAVTETIPAGGTEDTIAVVPAGAPPSPNGFALYNRNLHVGMLTFIHP